MEQLSQKLLSVCSGGQVIPVTAHSGQHAWTFAKPSIDARVWG